MRMTHDGILDHTKSNTDYVDWALVLMHIQPLTSPSSHAIVVANVDEAAMVSMVSSKFK